MGLIILTTLGGSNYAEATYRWQDYPQYTTKLVSAALAHWFPEAEVKVLLTPFAQQKNGALLQELLPQAQALPIANGETEEDSWNLFQTVADAVPEGAEVIFDVTHGFRSLPIVTLLALSYLRIVKGVQLRAVVYGAWQAGQDTTPIFDLTPFAALLDWAQAASRFQDTGDARLFKELLEMKRQASYNAVSRQLETLSQAIFSNRGLAVPDEAAKLLRLLEKAQEGQLESHQRPFALVMQQLEQQISPLAASQDGRLRLEAEYALICWYAERGHYPQALSLAREWLISVRQWHELERISMDEDERESLNADVWAAIQQLQDGGDAESSETGVPGYPGLDARLHAYAYATNQVAKRRNDFMHFGFKNEPMTVKKVGPRSQKALSLLPSAVRPFGLELEPPKGGDIQ